MARKDLVQTACILTKDQHARLKALSQKTCTPVTGLLRQAVNKLLAEHAKKKGEVL